MYRPMASRLLPGGIFAGLGLIFFLVALILSLVALSGWLHVQSYQAGQCTITAKRLDHEISTTTTQNGNTEVTSTSDVYAPYFEFTVQTTNHRSYSATGYDGTSVYTSDRAGQQAIVDAYQIGHSYQCWYNSSNPAQAVLVRSFNWVLILIGSIFMLIAIIFIPIGILMLLGRIGTNRIRWNREIRLTWNRNGDTF